MTFVYPLLLSGLALIGIPILVHLIMRQKPNHLLFPAVRFLLARHRTNQRKLQLRPIPCQQALFRVERKRAGSGRECERYGVAV